MTSEFDAVLTLLLDGEIHTSNELREQCPTFGSALLYWRKKHKLMIATVYDQSRKRWTYQLRSNTEDAINAQRERDSKRACNRRHPKADR